MCAGPRMGPFGLGWGTTRPGSLSPFSGWCEEEERLSLRSFQDHPWVFPGAQWTLTSEHSRASRPGCVLQQDGRTHRQEGPWRPRVGRGRGHRAPHEEGTARWALTPLGQGPGSG